jgi:hypothetical protein
VSSAAGGLHRTDASNSTHPCAVRTRCVPRRGDTAHLAPVTMVVQAIEYPILGIVTLHINLYIESSVGWSWAAVCGGGRDRSLLPIPYRSQRNRGE